MCITSDMPGILAGCKASSTKAVSFLKETNLGYLSCWKCSGQISKKEDAGGWKMGPNVLTEMLNFAPQIKPGFILEPISLSKALIPTACQTPHHISATFPLHWNMMQKAAFCLWGPVQKQDFGSVVMAETDWNRTLPWCGIKHHTLVTRICEWLSIQAASEIFFPTPLLSIQ